MQFDGSSPRKPVSATHSPGSRSWSEWTQQLQAYVAWVNSQLRKKPGTKEVGWQVHRLCYIQEWRASPRSSTIYWM